MMQVQGFEEEDIAPGCHTGTARPEVTLFQVRSLIRASCTALAMDDPWIINGRLISAAVTYIFGLHP